MWILKRSNRVLSLMKFLLIRIFRKIIREVVKQNSELAAAIEIDMKYSQGKGSGSGSTKLEAKLGLKFLPKHIQLNPVLLDVGACTGSYSEAVLELSPNAKIYAFEPSPDSVGILNKKFLKSDQVVIYPFALGEENSERILYANSPGSALASFSKRRLQHISLEFEHKDSVQVKKLDDWCKSQLITPNLLKIDVEGHELEVLRGGIETLKNISVVQFEFGGCNIDSKTYFQDFWYLFKDLNFSIFRIAKLGAIPILSYSEEDEYFSTTNFLAVKN